MFVQIGDRAFNPDWVSDIQFTDDEVFLYFAVVAGGSAGFNQIDMIFKNEEAEDFIRWWEEKAEVHRCL